MWFQLEEQRIEQWLKDWAEKGEERAIAHRKMLEAVLAHPDNGPEKALQKSLEVSDATVQPPQQVGNVRYVTAWYDRVGAFWPNYFWRG